MSKFLEVSSTGSSGSSPGNFDGFHASGMSKSLEVSSTGSSGLCSNFSLAGLYAHLQHVIGVFLAFTSLGPRGTVLVVISMLVELFLCGGSTFLSMA
jgi:hypothetical protein